MSRGPLTQGPHWRCTPFPLGEPHDDILTLFFSQAVLPRPDAGLFNTFPDPIGRESHRLDCSYWLDQLYMFFVMGPEAFLACGVYLGGFTAPCCTFGLGCLSPILPSLLERLPRFFFYLRSYRSFYWRVYLVSSLICVFSYFTQAFYDGAWGIFGLLSIPG